MRQVILTPSRINRQTNFTPANVYKGLSKADLEHAFEGVEWPTQPMLHQAASIAWALDNRDCVYYWHDVGTGKTLTSLYVSWLWGCRKIFVVSPNTVVYGWADQIEEHFPGPKVAILKGRAEDRRDEFLNVSEQEDHLITVINYGGLRYLFGAEKTHSLPYTTTLTYELDPDLSLYGFDCLIVDEAHHVANPRAVRTKLLMKASCNVPHIICMSGTPIRHDERDLWSQFMIVDRGGSLGSDYTTFLFGNFQKSYYDWKIKDGCDEDILEAIEPVTMRYSQEECIDLPEVVREKRYLDLSKVQQKQLDVLMKELTTEEEITREQARSYGLQIMKICGGIKASFTDEDELMKLKDVPKIEGVMEALREISGKVILFHHFILEGHLLEQACKKHKIGYRSIRGETRDHKQAIEDFVNDPDVRVLIAHPECASEGINVQSKCSNVFFYSRHMSPAGRKQAEGRVVRTGQKKSCLLLDFVAKDTVDEVNLKALEKNRDCIEDIMEWMQNR